MYVHAANIHDTRGGVYTFEKALYRYPTIQAGCADGGYRGTFKNTFEEFHNIRIDISMQIKEHNGFQVIPKRWVVERTFAWPNSSRRLSKDYELSSCSAECMIVISHVFSDNKIFYKLLFLILGYGEVGKIRLLWYNKEKRKELKSMKKVIVDENRRCPKCGIIENQIKIVYNSLGTQHCKGEDCNIRYTLEPKNIHIYKKQDSSP